MKKGQIIFTPPSDRFAEPIVILSQREYDNLLANQDFYVASLAYWKRRALFVERVLEEVREDRKQ